MARHLSFFNENVSNTPATKRETDWKECRYQQKILERTTCHLLRGYFWICLIGTEESHEMPDKRVGAPAEIVTAPTSMRTRRHQSSSINNNAASCLLCAYSRLCTLCSYSTNTGISKAGWGHTSAQNASVATHVVTSVVEIERSQLISTYEACAHCLTDVMTCFDFRWTHLC
jgi:hypothetical protein